MKSVKDNPHFDPAGYHVGHAELMLGLFYKAKKRRDPAASAFERRRKRLAYRNLERLRCLRGPMRRSRSWEFRLFFIILTNPK